MRLMTVMVIFVIATMGRYGVADKGGEEEDDDEGGGGDDDEDEGDGDDDDDDRPDDEADCHDNDVGV